MILNNKLRIKLMLCAQNALLGEITPNMRAVFIREENNTIHTHFYFDGEVTEEDEENAACIETEIIANFSDPFMCELHVLRVDIPNSISFPNEEGELVFLRKDISKN